MARPRIPRCIAQTPRAVYFKPRGIPMVQLQEKVLGMEEMEALRLSDMDGLSTQEAAARMRVSRHTFGRILKRARRIVAEALCQGCALRIEGGHYTLTLNAKENSTISCKT